MRPRLGLPPLEFWLGTSLRQFDTDEINAAYVLNKKPPPTVPSRLNEVVRHVAMLGGFLARKGDGEPGVKTLWLGLQRVLDFAAGIRFMRASGDMPTCV